jgi:hypothetical protein
LLTGLRAHRRLLGGSIQEYLLVAVALFAIAELIMGFTLFIPGAVFTAAPGDATSGFLVVIRDAKGWDFTLGYTTMSNYPFGDAIAKSAFITWIAVLGPLWLLSRVMEPTTALALVTVLGYMTSGLGMYGLVKRITGHWYVAVFAGYAAAFLPYHVYKSSDHLTNVFNVVMILVIGFFVAVWRRATRARIIGLALSVALACYTDGYYILIAGLTIGALIIAAVFSDRFIGDVPWRQIGRRLLKVVIAGVLAAILLLPIAGVFAFQNRELQNDLGQQRGAILDEALNYSAHPIDFVLPAKANPIVTHSTVLKALYDIDPQRSNLAERANYLGWTVILLVLVGYGGVLVGMRRPRKPVAPRQTAEPVALVALPLVIVWAFGPELGISPQLAIRMPYNWLIHVTELWRVPARIVLAVQPLAVLGAAAVLDRLLSGLGGSHSPWAKRMGRGARALPVVLSLALTAVLAFEYWTPTASRPFSAADMPETYTWIAQQSDIGAILELPLGAHTSSTGSYYAYAQSIHGRPTINSSLGTQELAMFDGLVGAQNPDTINLARRRGVDIVVVHGSHCLTYPWGNLVHSETNVLGPNNGRDDICVYRLKPASDTDDMFPSVTVGLCPFIMWHPDGESGVCVKAPSVVVNVVDSAGKPYATGWGATLLTSMRTVGNEVMGVRWTATQNNTIVGSGQVESSNFEVQAVIATGSPVTLAFTDASGHPVPTELETMGFEIKARS